MTQPSWPRVIGVAAGSLIHVGKIPLSRIASLPLSPWGRHYHLTLRATRRPLILHSIWCCRHALRLESPDEQLVKAIEATERYTLDPPHPETQPAPFQLVLHYRSPNPIKQRVAHAIFDVTRHCYPIGQITQEIAADMAHLIAQGMAEALERRIHAPVNLDRFSAPIMEACVQDLLERLTP